MNPMSLNKKVTLSILFSRSMGGKIFSPIIGKLLYAHPALVPATKAPDTIVIKTNVMHVIIRK